MLRPHLLTGNQASLLSKNETPTDQINSLMISNTYDSSHVEREGCPQQSDPYGTGHFLPGSKTGEDGFTLCEK
jgi:hypothetical protein